MGRKRNLVHGFGISDSEEPLSKYINGKQVKCHFYVRWSRMIERCYSLREQKRYPSYRGCTVCEEWRYFSNFKAWMEKQDWEGNHLDKDLLVEGNKIYSPENCIFVSNRLNQFTKDNSTRRGKFLIGVTWHKPLKKFIAYCNNPFTGKSENLGYFNNELDAHLSWLHRKHELSLMLAEEVEDPRLKKVLQTKYKPN